MHCVFFTFSVKPLDLTKSNVGLECKEVVRAEYWLVEQSVIAMEVWDEIGMSARGSTAMMNNRGPSQGWTPAEHQMSQEHAAIHP